MIEKVTKKEREREERWERKMIVRRMGGYLGIYHLGTYSNKCSDMSLAV